MGRLCNFYEFPIQAFLPPSVLTALPDRSVKLFEGEIATSKASVHGIAKAGFKTVDRLFRAKEP